MTDTLVPVAQAQFTKITRRRVYAKACDRIRARIARGDYRPCDNLPPERDLAPEFGVGRPAVREALRSLENADLLNVKAGLRGGAFVQEVDRATVTQSIHDLLNLGHITLGALMEARIVITISVVQMACEGSTAEEFDTNERCIDVSQQLEIYGTLDERPAAGTELFRLISVAAHDEALLLLVDSLSAIVRRMVRSVGPQTTALIPLRRGILTALRQRDTLEALVLLKDFFAQVHLQLQASAARR